MLTLLSRPLLSIIIPTVGRPGLRATVASIEQQQPGGQVEVVVVADTHSGPIDGLADYVHMLGPRYRFFEHDGGYHMVGHPQRNFGMRQARGQWLHFMADDDIYTPRAFQAIRRAIATLAEPKPLLFRVRTWQAGIVWWRPTLGEGEIDAECIVVPNEPTGLGVWTARYPGDFDFIQETVERWGSCQWEREQLAICRPSPAEDWTQLRAGVAV